MAGTKRCLWCSEDKALGEYNRMGASPDGLNNRCRSCVSAYKKHEYQRHRAAYIARSTKRQNANKDAKREYDRRYRLKNADKLDALKAQWRGDNQAKVRQIKAEYKRRNPHREAEHAMRRNARKRQATPRWLTEVHYDEMRLIYLDAATRPGGPWHVDHIVPLGGATVCGLHVPWNLRVILATENCAKHNRLIEDEALAA